MEERESNVPSSITWHLINIICNFNKRLIIPNYVLFSDDNLIIFDDNNSFNDQNVNKLLKTFNENKINIIYNICNFMIPIVQKELKYVLKGYSVLLHDEIVRNSRYLQTNKFINEELEQIKETNYNYEISLKNLTILNKNMFAQIKAEKNKNKELHKTVEDLKSDILNMNDIIINLEKNNLRLSLQNDKLKKLN